MKITREFIEQHRTKRGGFTFAQCQALGAGWPPQRGWLERAVKVEHSDAAIAIFIESKSRASTKAERRAQRVKRYAAINQAGICPTYSQPKKLRAQKPQIKPIQVAIRAPKCDPASDEFLVTYEWRTLRMHALKRYGARCQCCGATPATGSVMNVDHIKPRRLFPHLAMDPENLQILCHDCNHGKGNWDQTDWREEDVDQSVVSMLREIARA